MASIGEVVDLPAHAEGHGDVYAVPVHFLDELLGGTEPCFGVGVEVGESGVAFEVGCPVVSNAVGEDVGVEVDDHGGIVMPCRPFWKRGWLYVVGEFPRS